VSILINGSATNYRHLWNTFKNDLMDDLIVQADKSDPNLLQHPEDFDVFF
jgi:hypothetical protein